MPANLFKHNRGEKFGFAAQQPKLEKRTPAEILGLTQEEFEKQKQIISSEYLLGLHAGCTTEEISNVYTTAEVSFRPRKYSTNLIIKSKRYLFYTSNLT